jgi:hypothetical protein
MNKKDDVPRACAPFGDVPIDEPESWRYGILLPTHNVSSGHVGFFVDHQKLSELIHTLRSASPGMRLNDAFEHVAMCAPIKALASDWRDDWSSRGYPRQGRHKAEAHASPYGLENPARAPSKHAERFAWLKVMLNAPASQDDDDFQRSCESFAAVFRQDLESRGVATYDWKGPSLRLGNGFHAEELMVQAREECEAACLKRQLKTEVGSAPSRKPKTL